MGNGFGANGCVVNTSPPCPLYPCKNGGTCNTQELVCQCPSGFSPPYCDPVAACNPNPCQNGGECVITGNNYSCRCPRNYEGINCERQRSGCNAVLRGVTGTLEYPPGNSTSYGNNARCAWLLRTDEDKVLNVTFSKFNLEDSETCSFDFLQIHDGRTSASQLLGRFCGNKMPMGGNFLSTRDSLYMFFRSDASHSLDGFKLSWTSSPPVCGGQIETTSFGTIASPGSPGNYPPNRDCWWFLSAPPGKRLQLHFLAMKIESHVDCGFDYLTIHDGGNEEAPILEKFCNTSHPEPFVSPNHELALHFHSDDDNTDTGFQIHYTVVEGIPGCGGTFTGLTGEISSPAKDGQYPNNLECDYLIKVAPGSKISIEFLEFSLEYHSECNFDHLEMYEGGSDKDPLVRRYCGTEVPDSYNSQGNKLFFKFRTDFSNPSKGFRISYSVVCGGTYHSDNGIVTSPMYPSPYHRDRECIFEIVAPLGKAIIVDWMDFDMEGNTYPECTYDFLEVYDGVATDSASVGRYCGTITPPRIVAKMNLVTLKMVSDSSIEGHGWKVNYTFVDMGCGGVIKTPNLTITPPQTQVQTRMEFLGTMLGGRTQADSVALHNQDCTWIIVAPPKQTVTLNWESFDIESSDACNFDYVEVSEVGVGSQKFCGTTIPSVMSTVGNMVKVRFVSDSSMHSEGFSLTYSFNNPEECE